jgi:hypothetical protein
MILIKSEHRKKKFDYSDWVRRTTTSEEQVKTVDAHLLSANQTIQNYFSIESTNDRIVSFTIDEWMALVEKH